MWNAVTLVRLSTVCVFALLSGVETLCQDITLARQALIADQVSGKPIQRISVDPLGEVYVVIDGRLEHISVSQRHDIRTVFDEKNIIDVQVDQAGAIWLLLADGQVMFVRRSETDVSGFDRPVAVPIDQRVHASSIAIDHSSKLHLIDDNTKRVYQFQRDGNGLVAETPSFPHPARLVTDDAGDLYVLDSELKRVFKTSGQKTMAYLEAGDSTDMAVTGSGEVFLIGSRLKHYSQDKTQISDLSVCLNSDARLAFSSGRLFASDARSVFELPVSNQTTFDFGNVDLGQSLESSIAICRNRTSRNTEPIRLQFTLSGPNEPDYKEHDYFLGENRPCSARTLATSETCILEISFSPSTLGSRNASLTVKANSGIWLIPMVGISLF